MRQFYLFAKSQPLVDQSISWSHYTILMTLDNQNEINYYIKQIAIYHWGKRTLQEKIKNKEYQRLSDEAKNKLINKEKFDIYDNIKNPVYINTFNDNIDKGNIEEKVLKVFILKDLKSFLKQLGNGFSTTTLKYMREFYIHIKSQAVPDHLIKGN